MAWKRTWKWLGAVSAALVLCGVTAWLLCPARHPITAETYERVYPGMTRAEAEELLGGPGATRQDFSDWLNNRSPTEGTGPDLLNVHRDLPGIAYWFQDSGVIIVRFDSQGQVADKQFLGMRVSAARQRAVRLLERIGW